MRANIAIYSNSELRYATSMSGKVLFYVKINVQLYDLAYIIRESVIGPRLPSLHPHYVYLQRQIAAAAACAG